MEIRMKRRNKVKHAPEDSELSGARAWWRINDEGYDRNFQVASVYSEFLKKKECSEEPKMIIFRSRKTIKSNDNIEKINLGIKHLKYD